MGVVKRLMSASLGLAALVLMASPAFADGQGSEKSASAAASSECPKSISARYPWIACRTTVMGTQVIAGPVGNDTWMGRRAMPSHDPFVNGIGYYGPSENGHDDGS